MKKIIIVDDDVALLDAVKLIFSPALYRVTVLSNGSSILDGNYELPDLFILDKQLSGEDGLDICRYLKSHEITRQIPVIMISANPNIVRLAKAAGAEAAIEKPFKMKDLRGSVENLLHGQ